MCNCKKALVVKIKRLSDKAVIPEYAKHDDACFDLVAADIVAEAVRAAVL